MSTRVYYGECECEGKTRDGKSCRFNAYWKLGGKYLCGPHSRRDAELRKPLPKRSKADQIHIEIEQARERVQAETDAAAENRANDRKGALTLQKMRMMHAPTVTPGVRNVFPNFKDQNRKSGFGCASLSPKAMGPVVHGQPGLPDALNIENFHQGSKCFAEELDDDGDPGPLYYENRRRFYLDPEPHRHKYKGCDGNANIPKFFVWVDRDDCVHHLTYIESRQFYCNFYERIAKNEDDYWRLCKDLDDGVNLEICGYDGNPIPEGQTVEDAYLDDSVPFGHERVLYTMLLFYVNGTPESEYPWRKHKTFEF